MELLDEVQIRALNMANGKNLTEVPTLMFEFIGTGETASYILYSPSAFSSYLSLYISCITVTLCNPHVLKKGYALSCNSPNHFYFCLFVSLSLLEAYAREQTQIVQQIASKHNGSDFVFAEESEAKKELWKVNICPTPNPLPLQSSSIN